MQWSGVNSAGFMRSTNPWCFSPMSDPLPLWEDHLSRSTFLPLADSWELSECQGKLGVVVSGGWCITLRQCFSNYVEWKRSFFGCFFFLICNLTEPDILEGAIKVTKNGIKKTNTHNTQVPFFFIRFNRHKLILPNGFQHFKCFLSILCWSPLWMVTKMATAGPILNSNILKDSEEPPKACHFLAVFLLWSSEGSHCSRGHYRCAGLWERWCIQGDWERPSGEVGFCWVLVIVSAGDLCTAKQWAVQCRCTGVGTVCDRQVYGI